MSEGNVEIVRASFVAAQQGDLEGALSNYSESVIWLNRPPEVGPYHRKEGVVQAIAGFAEHFDDYWFEVEQLIDARDAVVMLWRQGGTGKSSGTSISEEGSTVFELEAGRICRAQVSSDRAAALQAAGLSE